jgi:hypothetical protein
MLVSSKTYFYQNYELLNAYWLRTMERETKAKPRSKSALKLLEVSKCQAPNANNELLVLYSEARAKIYCPANILHHIKAGGRNVRQQKLVINKTQVNNITLAFAPHSNIRNKLCLRWKPLACNSQQQQIPRCCDVTKSCTCSWYLSGPLRNVRRI